MCDSQDLALISTPVFLLPQPPEDLCVGGDGTALRVRRSFVVGRERWGTWGLLGTVGWGTHNV